MVIILFFSDEWNIDGSQDTSNDGVQYIYSE